MRLSEVSKPGRTRGNHLSWVTCYDYSFARAVERSGVDMILVGDSGAMVALGFGDTSQVTVDQMLEMTKAVRRGASSGFVVGDMPRGSYEVSDEVAVINAMRFVKEGLCDAVKLEGGSKMAKRVAAIVDSGIPVLGHIGLTPQTAVVLGGYRVVGRALGERDRIVNDAIHLQDAGVSGILVEAVPSSVAQEVRAAVNIPIFGIGAGPNLDGQLLILHDILGLYPDFRPRFAKCFVPDAIALLDGQDMAIPELSELNVPADGLAHIASLALALFSRDVRTGVFPGPDHTYAEAGR